MAQLNADLKKLQSKTKAANEIIDAEVVSPEDFMSFSQEPEEKQEEPSED